MRKTNLIIAFSFLVCFAFFFGCAAVKNVQEPGRVQVKATDDGTPSGAKDTGITVETDVQKMKEGYVEDVTFDRLRGKERITLYVSRFSGFKVDRISEETLMIELADMFIPEELRIKLGESSLKIVDYVLPLQKTIEGKKYVYFEIALKEMVPYIVKEEKRRIVIDFDVSVLSYAPVPVIKEIIPKKKKAGKKAAIDAKSLGSTKDLQEIERKEGEKYTGSKISLDLQDADIKSVFRLLSESGNTNIVSGEDVQGSITVYMRNVPWDQALDTILDTNGLVMKQMGDVITVITLEKLQKDEAMRKQGEEDRINAELLHRASEQKRLVEAGKLRQISIEAKIVEATTDFARDLGVQWGYGYKDTWKGRDYGMLIGSGASGAVTTLPGGIGVTNSNIAVNFPSAAGVAAPAVGLILGSSKFVLDAQISALEGTGEGKIISSPKVVTLDNVKATIEQGQEIPYATIDKEGFTTTQFKDATLKLEVKPKITPDNRISLEVKATNNYADWTKTNVNNENPPINKSEVVSTIVVEDGDTVVVGGIYKMTETKSTSGVPGLSKIPILGWLFKTESKRKAKREILIFITPRIFKESQKRVLLEGDKTVTER